MPVVGGGGWSGLGRLNGVVVAAVSVAVVHRSRLYGFFVDSPLAEAERSVAFWASALGATPVHRDEDDDPFVALRGGAGVGLAFEVQAVDDVPRYHLDIETDDVAAETARLLGLGATEVDRQDGWVVLRAPGGHLLCVVPVQSEPDVFAADANTWS
jgi:catechol 2,3-dioxygenase-like lactoylglutathione lyase family enzyme